MDPAEDLRRTAKIFARVGYSYSSCPPIMAFQIQGRQPSFPVRHTGTGARFGSNLGPIIAENRVKPWSVTQNQAKRINEIALRWLLRDQGVGGSNPLSPTISS